MRPGAMGSRAEVLDLVCGLERVLADHFDSVHGCRDREGVCAGAMEGEEVGGRRGRWESSMTSPLFFSSDYHLFLFD